MELSKQPFNISLLPNDRKVIANLSPITSSDIFEGATTKLNDDGLFSTTIFGRVGEERRASTFAYIDLRTTILHPILYKNIEKIASFYTQIMSGQAYGKWDEKSKTIIESDQIDGETGYSFFMKHFKNIKFQRNDSPQRNLRIDVLDKFRETAFYDFIIVIPAGIRDIEEDVRGNLKQNEINEYYRALIGLSKNIDKTFKDNRFNDGTRLLMQRNFNSIYELLFSYLNGKRGITQSKFAKRRIDTSTRSVLQVVDLAVEDMRSESSYYHFTSSLGLLQAAKSSLPLTQFAFKDPLIMDIFGGDNTATVINPETLLLEQKPVSAKIKQRYTTEDGVNEWLNKFMNTEIRHKPIMISGSYLALIYKDDKGFKIVRDVRNVPEDKLKLLAPITYAELLYYLLKPILVGKYAWITRFPYAELGSTTANLIHLKTTEKSESLYLYDDNWELDKERSYPEFPIKGGNFVETSLIHSSQLLGKGGDMDGDTVSVEIVFSDESIKELNDMFNNLDILFTDGRLYGFATTDTMGWVLHNMSI